jgi:hypothetical protein
MEFLFSSIFKELKQFKRIHFINKEHLYFPRDFFLPIQDNLVLSNFSSYSLLTLKLLYQMLLMNPDTDHHNIFALSIFQCQLY